jgi:hypothetical protein
VRAGRRPDSRVIRRRATAPLSNGSAVSSAHPAPHVLPVFLAERVSYHEHEVDAALVETRDVVEASGDSAVSPLRPRARRSGGSCHPPSRSFTRSSALSDSARSVATRRRPYQPRPSTCFTFAMASSCFNAKRAPSREKAFTPARTFRVQRHPGGGFPGAARRRERHPEPGGARAGYREGQDVSERDALDSHPTRSLPRESWDVPTLGLVGVGRADRTPERCTHPRYSNFSHPNSTTVAC